MTKLKLLEISNIDRSLEQISDVNRQKNGKLSRTDSAKLNRKISVADIGPPIPMLREESPRDPPNMDASNHYSMEKKMIFQYIKRMDYRRLKGLLSNLAQINFFCNEGYGHTGSSSFEPLDITIIYDKQGFNPLHFAALNNSLKAI